MESPYPICTIGPNRNTDFCYDAPFRRYSPLGAVTPFSFLLIAGLGFEPRTLGSEAKCLTTLATEARLVSRTVTLFLYLSLP